MRFKIEKTTYKSGRVRYLIYKKVLFGRWKVERRYRAGGEFGYYVKRKFDSEAKAIRWIKKYLEWHDDNTIESKESKEYTREEIENL